MRQALAREPFLKTDGQYPTREEIYTRERMATASAGWAEKV
jgi:hypothetical protein